MSRLVEAINLKHEQDLNSLIEATVLDSLKKTGKVVGAAALLGSSGLTGAAILGGMKLRKHMKRWGEVEGFDKDHNFEDKYANNRREVAKQASGKTK